MLAGRMMDFPLTLTHLLERARTQFPTATIVSTQPDKSRTRATYADFSEKEKLAVQEDEPAEGAQLT
jgi:fatty-acyl-CoA synthase